jgi:hypothetical protein
VYPADLSQFIILHEINKEHAYIIYEYRTGELVTLRPGIRRRLLFLRRYHFLKKANEIIISVYGMWCWERES